MNYIILAIETSLDCCSITIHKKKYIYSISKICKKKHTEIILPMIKKALSYTETKFNELNFIALAKGPGNFTSLRISTSIAQSLSISLQIPIIGISTLKIMAEKVWRKYKKKQILVAINAKKGYLYWAEYIRVSSIWKGRKTEILIDEESVEKKIKNIKTIWTTSGDGWKTIKYENPLIKKYNIFFPSSKDLIPLAILAIKNKKTHQPSEISPNYLNNIL
ncbi:tRNA (adenosine(37)-N6)-threonylcarbamoyltransferase complex dimerization subunit type 1 TsaB [Buchnera aphidicola (Muscaphis stroyani)]|uniref:tRNA threonylcarbamoyladenosine biosynthesis protein TsaB n=1 Tax=Buchnera aphidicola (Muscaphis stroyani) TaxID=1241869 RepID=A0A4D6YEY9_9GAMM|nr:tRNA (adenosine(37)-N6)-threonylcarbamoyltransferase complex dimerization subunit type 1 TsaB [Buchnera aphidicola]QCI24394.1 tRNA (adenosine(37)-N6)-threonylcarbamoyltransferase complex dimerization subunit type 1 TsaB [Buchnera aphidicola (Muscaphis stroyani)]